MRKPECADPSVDEALEVAEPKNCLEERDDAIDSEALSQKLRISLKLEQKSRE